MIIKCTGEEKNICISDDVFEKPMWLKESGQIEKRNNKREVRV